MDICFETDLAVASCLLFEKGEFTAGRRNPNLLVK